MKSFHIQKESFNAIQKHIMTQFRNTMRFAVVGGPGTGKTLLALEGFNQILGEESAHNIAFIVYNKALKEFLSRYLNYGSEDDVIHTWHSWLFKYLMRTFDLSFDDVKARYQIKPFVFDFKKIEMDLDQLGTYPKYYYIFVDEAQDFPDELLKIIDKVSMKLYVFLDDNQRFTPELLDTNTPFSSIEQSSVIHTLNLEEDFYDLTDNFRNTKPIEKVIKIYDFNYHINNITLRRNTVHKDGPKPRLLDVSDKQLLVNHVVQEQIKQPLKSIGLLMPKIKEQKLLLDEYRDLFLKHPATNQNNFYVHSSDNNATLNDSGIFLMTYQIAKGLEFDHVYLLELNHPSFKYDFYHKNAFYVSLTRAESLLTFVYDNHLRDSEVILKAKKYHDFFETIDLKEGEKS